jgi:hypothetical protein
VTTFEKSLYFFKHRAGRLEQLDHLQNSSHSFIIGQVAQNNFIQKKQKNKNKNKKTNKKKSGSSFE